MRRPLPFVLPCLLVACSGTETGNPPVIDFGNSGCHDQSYGTAAQNKGVIRQSLDEPGVVPDATYRGLTCMVWNRVDDDSVRFLITNYESGCGSDSGWKPKAALSKNGGLDLRIEDSDCSSAACGWCLYDLSITVRLEEALADEQVRLYQTGCTDTDPEKSALLALGSHASGAVCGYANRFALAWKGGAGHAFGPCGDVSFPASIACDEGLTCTDVSIEQGLAAGSDMRCLPNCTSNSDCNAVTTCQAGSCKPASPGVMSSFHGEQDTGDPSKAPTPTSEGDAAAPDAAPRPDASIL